MSTRGASPPARRSCSSSTSSGSTRHRRDDEHAHPARGATDESRRRPHGDRSRTDQAGDPRERLRLSSACGVGDGKQRAREDVRARQGGAAQPRDPDRHAGRLRRSQRSPRSPLSHSQRGIRPARRHRVHRGGARGAAPRRERLERRIHVGGRPGGGAQDPCARNRRRRAHHRLRTADRCAGRELRCTAGCRRALRGRDLRLSQAGRCRPRRRRLRPLALVEYESRWHVFGIDAELSEDRIFLLSRIVGEVQATSETFDAALQAGAGERALAGLEAVAAQNSALLQVTPGTEAAIRLGRRAIADADGIRVSYVDRDVFADELTSYGPEVRVVEPADLRDAVIARLRAVVAAHEESR
ncbi:WYL domain-containing protein [Microbacterium sp. NIBRBAC000506063]|uniref:WYL domain-containing protein n=1 Tax=Microbacterium sp. NIBRBAC000506063 TaxID=2734618 RepID=UPI001CB7250A|nr:WYL domain-containing protein [Microbacterium sp. NIBRBAC000506063]